jgi:sialidase-1
MRMLISLAVSLALLLSTGGDGYAQENDERGAVALSFEEAAAGEFEKLETPLGIWTVNVGRAIVDNKHAKTGRHCLQLTGGEQTTVTLDLADGVDTSGELRFWAERWTKRTPFLFRIEKNSSDGWKEVFNGDKEVRVGRAFLSHVRVPLQDAKIRQLRFSSSSPPNTGILIDDVRIAPARPQKVLGVDVVPFTLPVLVGRESSPIARLKIDTEGILNPVSVTTLKFTIAGEENLEALQLMRGGIAVASPVPLPAVAGQSDITWRFLPVELSDGSNVIDVECELKPGANIDDRVGLAISEVTLSNGQTFKLQSPMITQRLGVAVRKGGDDGAHTFRIPGLATTNAGTLIGVYDVRRRNGGDLPGDIDVGMSRSTDGGRTWGPMRVIMDMGDDPQWNYDGIGDPAVLVDRNTGTIWVAGTWSHGNRSWRGSGPGLSPEETGQLMLVRSDDDGVTWSKPINITQQVKKPEWCFILQGPGKGITMRDGTIVFAAQYQDPPEQKRLPHSTIIYSKDHGETWHAATGAFDDTTESQVVEIEPGVLMLNCRYNRKSARVVMTTRDLGQTWQKHPTSERSLLEPSACMASLINVYQELGKDVGGWLLFSNPDSLQARERLMIKASNDGGLTWPKQHRLLLDEHRNAGYSCMTMIDEQTVGILYEGSQAQMTFQRIPMSDILGKPDAPIAETAGRNSARVSLPDVLGDHMVLQADAEIPVWGRGPTGADISVTFGEETQRTTVDANGDWQVRLAARKASAKPAKLLIQSGCQRVELNDVLVGEVWVCAGQSNMEWPLSQSTNGGQELAAADHPTVRLLHLVGGAKGTSLSFSGEQIARLTPQAFCKGEWRVASAESAREFSAVGWYFGHHLQQSLNVPIGLIGPAVGGTPTEAWIPREALAGNPELKGLVAGNWLDNKQLGEFCRTRGEQNLLRALQSGEVIPGDDLGPNHAFKPGFMWESGVKPLLPYAIRGVIWYQGESNAETAERVRQHQHLFPLLVSEWRKHWGQGNFPFLQVQLPAMNRSDWPAFREVQRRLTERLDNVGMAITIDTGHPSNVHPPLKQPVGQRLAEWALGTTYGLKQHATYSGPLFDIVKRKGDAIAVSFRHVGDGLKTSDNLPPRHFEITGADGVFHPATAKMTGQNTITVSSPEVAEPLHVRYAWTPFPEPSVNVFNSVGLPASSFSTEPYDGQL